MNPRQRRGVLLLGVAVIGAIVVFLVVVTYVADVNKRVGSMVPALQLRLNVPAYAVVTPQMVQSVMIPAKWLPATVLHDPAALNGFVAAAPLRGGSFLQQDMLVPPPALGPGQRELAILLDAGTGVAGQIHPGSTVDILATFKASPTNPAGVAVVIVPDAQIINVGAVQTDSGQNSQGAFSQNQKVPVTFAVSPHDALVVAYAESFATEVRLALRSPADQTSVPPSQRSYP